MAATGKEINWLKLDFDAISERLEQRIKDATEAGQKASEDISEEEKARLIADFETSLKDMEFFIRIFVPNVGKEVGMKRKMAKILNGEDADASAINWDLFDLDATETQLHDVSATHESRLHDCVDDTTDEDAVISDKNFMTALDNYRFFMREFAPFFRKRAQAFKRMSEILKQLYPNEQINWGNLDIPAIQKRLGDRLSAVETQIREFEKKHTGVTDDIPEGAVELGTEYEAATTDFMFFMTTFKPICEKELTAMRKMTEILNERIPDLIPQ